MLELVRDRILRVHLDDNVKARVLQSDGSYARATRHPGEKKLRSQKWFIENRGCWHEP